MDNRTVKLAMLLIEQKLEAQKHKDKANSTEKRLQGIEIQLRRMFEVLESMKEKSTMWEGEREKRMLRERLKHAEAEKAKKSVFPLLFNFFILH